MSFWRCPAVMGLSGWFHFILKSEEEQNQRCFNILCHFKHSETANNHLIFTANLHFQLIFAVIKILVSKVKARLNSSLFLEKHMY